MEVEKAGLKVEFKKNPEPTPEAFQRKLEENPVLKTAFEALTSERQCGYILYFLNGNKRNGLDFVKPGFVFASTFAASKF